MSTPCRENRGPRAAAENRRALVAAAREVFAESGIDAPLSAVARRAGVGQGSLYRHFPDRTSLALAVFEDNVVELEHLAAGEEVALDELVTLLLDQIVASVAFVDLLAAAAEDPRVEQMAGRVRSVLESRRPAERSSGLVGADLTADDLLLALSMVAGAVARAPAGSRRTTAERAWRMLRLGLVPRDG